LLALRLVRDAIIEILEGENLLRNENKRID